MMCPFYTDYFFSKKAMYITNMITARARISTNMRYSLKTGKSSMVISDHAIQIGFAVLTFISRPLRWFLLKPFLHSTLDYPDF